jgi:hypothetical protein
MNGLLNGNRISDLSTYIKWSLTNEGFDERETRQILKWLLEDLLQKLGQLLALHYGVQRMKFVGLEP